MPAAGSGVKVPDPTTVWTAPQGAVLAPGKPVTLTWDNGQGLIFTRTISVDDDYLFTVKQDVENRTNAPVTLYPYARLQREGTPQVAGVYVLFEGLLGWVGGGLQEVKYTALQGDKPPVKVDSTGGWLGFTDKYWATALIPDVLFQAHSASLGAVFYTGAMFPAEYRNDAFVAFHGSWNRSLRTGYKVVRVRFRDGKPVGGYEDFLTGFLLDEGNRDVWGRPVSVLVARDGALLVSDDGGHRVWRVSYSTP